MSKNQHQANLIAQMIQHYQAQKFQAEMEGKPGYASWLQLQIDLQFATLLGIDATPIPQ